MHFEISREVAEQWATSPPPYPRCIGRSDERTPAPTRAPTTGSFLPAPPDTSQSDGPCVTTYDGLQGQCIHIRECTGGTFNNLCSNPSANVKCCVPETTPAQVQTRYLTLVQFRRQFESLSETRAGALLHYFNEALSDLLADHPSQTVQCHRVAAFIAQLGHESNGLLWFEEIASGEAYEGRCGDLGNCQVGDGRRYKGRGPIQLTGRANYQQASDDLHVDFVGHPESVNMPSGGFRAATWFWMSNNLNRFCTGREEDFIDLTRAINGGLNGLQDRLDRWNRARHCPWL
eukprot:Sspe_Gene.93194::Locus_65882_Transcript_1_1_Confidence_1.000_Length_1381::g.93194::m.93194/K03791/K03791; putative chitinase